jgi:large subunit ribosomal protein L30
MEKSMKLKIMLKKSFIGQRKKTRDTVLSLGLKKLHHSVVKEDTPSVRGMIKKVNFMLSVEEVDEVK